ncbi:hypothetical protein P8K93_001126 [Campylobacter coli]|nr:hypothetical protein [Campylobacter coli]
MKLKDFDFRIWDGEKYINLKNDGGNDSITHRCEGYAIGLIGDEKPIYNIKAGKGFVQYHKGIFKIINKKSSHEYCVTYLGYILCRENIEIIGNIHENGELIKGIE